ncbi:TIGR02285 family protein [Bdellovibrio sp. NC01]|uniref:TIGR02285 family protein n=1 Tax=Bdellovibrio sp. NC01 TaxID=2220073 RepID=UPI00115BB070|nr:TIGR02285 family protein [Bdellovibrio sp. NC01]QDK37641.1 hypothetical protein DOE51_08630 [Bdellovibrio sp. NC01]
MLASLFSFIFSVSFLFSSSFAEAASTKERIIWYKPNWPPYFETSGPRAGQGYIDKLLDYLQSQMPDTQFESLYYSLNSLAQMRKQSPYTCNVSHLRTPEREKYAYFTAFYIQPPPQLVFRTEDFKNKMFEAKVVSLARLLDQKDLRAGLSADRSYGSTLDAIIKTHKNKSNVETLQGIPDSSSTLNMLSAKRFDYAIEYEEVARYLQSNKLVIGNFSFAEIEEQRGLVVVHIACSKTDWGLKTISRLDSILRRISGTPKYKELMESWHSEALLKSYRKEFDEFYQRRSSETWTNAPSLHKD